MQKISKLSGIKTLQAVEPPYSVSNGPIKNDSEIIAKWRMIYKISHRISILLNVQRNEKGGDSRISCTRRIVKFVSILIRVLQAVISEFKNTKFVLIIVPNALS